MASLLESLHELQSIEITLQALRDKIDRKWRSVRVHQRQLKELEEALAAKHEEITRRQVAYDSQNLEVQSREAVIAKLRENLNKAKTNKEYSAILTQINTTKADNLKVEDFILESMQILETLKQEEAAIRDQRLNEAKRLAEVEAVAKQFESEIAEELAGVERQRAEAAKNIPAEALGTFTRVAERHEGEALVEVRQPYANLQEYVCEGCNLKIRIEIVNALLTRDDLQVCSNCGRILFLDSMAQAGS
jgi:predicted  nucleic acid-binding Zn-ribbon protein